MNKRLKDIIDLGRYPLHQQNSDQYRLLVDRLASGLDARQVCVLQDFLRPACRVAEVQNLIELLPRANPARSLRNVYLERSRTESLPDDHPKNILAQASYRMMGAHILPDNCALKTLYYWEPFRQFVADVTGSGQLYTSDDPYQPVNVLCHGAGDKSAWHFDSTNAFTMTLTLQSPESGGIFEMAPEIRSDDDPNIDELRSLLLGDRSRVRTYEREEGALMIFRGCNSAHRVTEVTGNLPRMMCVMVYEDKPGVVGDPVVNETVYGVRAPSA